MPIKKNIFVTLAVISTLAIPSVFASGSGDSNPSVKIAVDKNKDGDTTTTGTIKPGIPAVSADVKNDKTGTTVRTSVDGPTTISGDCFFGDESTPLMNTTCRFVTLTLMQGKSELKSIQTDDKGMFRFEAHEEQTYTIKAQTPRSDKFQIFGPYKGGSTPIIYMKR